MPALTPPAATHLCADAISNRSSNSYCHSDPDGPAASSVRQCEGGWRDDWPLERSAGALLLSLGPASAYSRDNHVDSVPLSYKILSR